MDRGRLHDLPQLDPAVHELLAGSTRLHTSNDIGFALGVYDGRCWARHGYQQVMEALTRLRDQGVVAKLPHEGARSGAVYVPCAGHEHAARLQLEASERALAGLSPERRAGLAGRLLEQVLDGLRRSAR